MKLLVIPNGFEANYVLGFLRGIVAQGVRPLVVSYDEIAAQLGELGIEHCNLHECQDPHRSIARKIGQLVAYYFDLVALVWRQRGQPFHYIGIFRNKKILMEGVLLASLFRILASRYYYTVHNVLPHHEENSRLFRFIYRWVYRIPHRLVVHTPGAAAQLQREFGIPADKIVTISIGLNEEVPRATVSTAAARQQLSLDTDAFWFLFFGKTEPYKGLDLLLEAWRQTGSKRVRLAVVGPCPDPAYRKQISSLIDRLPEPESVTWREGFVANEELGLWLKAVDAGVLPYRNIYQSGVVFLYLQHGLPILASEVGNLDQYVGDKEGRLLPVGDQAAWSTEMSNWAQGNLTFDREQIRQSARTYSWEKVCIPLIKDYEGLPSC